jgi:hypothetical protein
MRCNTRLLGAIVVSGTLAQGGASQAQFYPTVIHPSALQPGANVAIPGSQQMWYDPVTGAMGYRYLGIDGQMHGTTNLYNPLTGQRENHVYARNPSAPRPAPAPHPYAPRPAAPVFRPGFLR